MLMYIFRTLCIQEDYYEATVHDCESRSLTNHPVFYDLVALCDFLMASLFERSFLPHSINPRSSDGIIQLTFFVHYFSVFTKPKVFMVYKYRPMIVAL